MAILGGGLFYKESFFYSISSFKTSKLILNRGVTAIINCD